MSRLASCSIHLSPHRMDTSQAGGYGPLLGDSFLEPVRYTALDSSDEIRCLQVEPGEHNDPITCTLQTLRLADNPQFEAISYVWGSDPRNQAITCDGRRLHITPNLRDALRQSRLRNRQCLLWVDLVCIDRRYT